MKKERLFYLDFVRAIATIAIIMTHFNARYLYLNPPMPEKAIITTTVYNIYIGNWGVALFFIISGAALMHIYAEKCEWKSFYKKRFLSIYPMFWMAYLAVFLWTFYTTKGMPGGGTPKSRIIFSALGFDGLLMTNGYQTFYMLGEWFLGVIIITYIMFPLLRTLINKAPVILVIGTIILYIGSLLICYYGPYQLTATTIIFVRLPELVFGMLFVKYRIKIGGRVSAVAVVLLALNGIMKPVISGDIQTTYVGILSFIVLVYLSKFLKKAFVERICSILSKYSYAIFLVHHVIIAKMMSNFDLISITRLQSYLLFLTICCVIGFFANVLYRLHDYAMREIQL